MCSQLKLPILSPETDTSWYRQRLGLAGTRGHWLIPRFCMLRFRQQQLQLELDWIATLIEEVHR